jgi:glycosyltransferase involved in cell wall biosynthesis
LLAYSDHGPGLISTYFLHKLTKLPFCLHFYDLYCGNNFPWFFTLAARFIEPRLFRSAERISVMSEALAEHYQNRYSREVKVLHNAVPLNSSRPSERVPFHSEPYKIVYTGTIVWAQAQAIRNLVHAVHALSCPKVVLHLYTPHDRRFLESQGILEGDRVVFARGLPHEMPAIQASADILFVGLSFNTRYPLLINTSSPGKNYEYLISGRPILIHAPRESYIARYAREHQFAHVVGENSIAGLKSGIEQLIRDRNYANGLVSNARKLVCKNHDASEASARFRQLLSNCEVGLTGQEIYVV